MFGLRQVGRTAPFMVFSVTYITCERPELDACMSQTVMFADYQYETIHRHN